MAEANNLLQKGQSQKGKETEIIKRALRATEDLNEQQLRQATRETIFAPSDRKIKLGNNSKSADELRLQVVNNIEKNGADAANKFLDDLGFKEAVSIENINSETSSSQEYFRWLNETSEILKNMNDGYVSDKDLSERNSFLELTHQREAELMVCLGLLANCRNPLAQEEYKKLHYKLTRLREMRASIKERTRNQADVEISVDEYNQALPAYKYFKALEKAPIGFTFTKEQKKRVGLDFLDYDDDEPDYRDFLIDVILDQMTEEDQSYISQEYQLAHDMADEERINRLQNISDKLQELSGRKNSFRIKYDIITKRKSLDLGKNFER